ncbi:hypothetical protein RLIN73S_02742 [Rhodanobacter lindaniclasticus]
MPIAPRIAGCAPCWWISNGRPMPAIITGNAANALPMMTVNSTMPSANTAECRGGVAGGQEVGGDRGDRRADTALGERRRQRGQQQRQQGRPADRIEQSAAFGDAFTHRCARHPCGRQQGDHAGQRQPGQGHLRRGEQRDVTDHQVAAEQRHQQGHQRNQQGRPEQSVAERDRRLQTLLGAAVLRVRLAPQPRGQAGQHDHPDAGDLRGQRVARGRLRQDQVAGSEQQPQHGPERGMPAVAVAQVAPAAVEQEGGNQPVGLFDPQHAQACPRPAAARRCRRRWYSQMRTDWMMKAATAVGSAHSAIASGLSSMPCWV